MNNFFSRIKTSDPQQRRSAGNIFKFLSLLLAFTIIARGTGGATLARVVLASPDRSEIIRSISGSATVSSTDSFDIAVPELLTIAEVLVAVGQDVETGDALAVFEMDGLEERFIRETASLERMNLDLEQLEREEGVDSGPLEREQRNLNRARQDYEATVRQGQEDIAAARAALDLLLEAAYDEGYILPSAIRSHRRALEDYLSTLEQGLAIIAAAEEALLDISVDDTALQTAIRTHQRTLDDYNAAIAEGEAAIAAAKEAFEELQNLRPRDQDRTAIENAQRAYNRAREDYNALRRKAANIMQTAQRALDDAIAMYQALMLWPNPCPIALASAAEAMLQAQNALIALQNQNNADPALVAAVRRVEDEAIRLAQAQREFDTANQNALEQAENALEAAKTQAAGSYLAASRRLEDDAIRLEQARQDYENSKQSEIERLENALETAKYNAERNQLAASRTLQDTSNTVSSEIERAQNDLVRAINKADADRQASARQVENARAALAGEQQRHGQSVQQAADTTIQNAINASTLQLDIAARQYTVKMLEALISNDGVLYADAAGSVSMAKQAGYVTNSDPVITLRDTNGGFEAQMLITQSEAERLRVGSEAEVTTGGGSLFFTPTTIATVSAVSLPNENDEVTVTLRLPHGSWNVGQRIDAQIILSRASYDLSVPIAAVQSDNAGYFLHVMEQRSTIMGLQNVVVRVNVTIIAADDMTASVLGAVGRNTQVIVSSNRPISVGDRVRESE